MYLYISHNKLPTVNSFNDSSHFHQIGFTAVYRLSGSLDLILYDVFPFHCRFHTLFVFGHFFSFVASKKVSVPLQWFTMHLNSFKYYLFIRQAPLHFKSSSYEWWKKFNLISILTIFVHISKAHLPQMGFFLFLLAWLTYQRMLWKITFD